MTATLHSHDTTNYAAQVVQVAQTMLAQEPELACRLQRAIGIALVGDIRDTAEIGVYLVASEDRDGTYYRASSGSCTCPDATKRERTCKHQLAVILRQCARAEEEFARVRWMYQYEARKAAERYTLTEAGYAATTPPLPADWRLPCPQPCPLAGQHPCRPAAPTVRLVGRA